NESAAVSGGVANFGNPAPWFDWLRDRTVGLVEVIGTLLAAVVLIWCWKDPPIRFVPRNAFALLAALPGFMAFAYHCISSLPRFHARREATRDYDLFVDGFDAWWTSEGWQKKLTNAGYPTTIGAHDFSVSARNDTDDDFLSFRPMLSGAIWGALLLSLVFLIAVGVADDHRFLMGIEPKEPGLQGFLFAALGAYVSVMWRMINRIHANALSYRFVFTATLRAAVAMAVGYVAARVNLFTLVKDSVSVAGLYFLIGLFTDWALASLRARARRPRRHRSRRSLQLHARAQPRAIQTRRRDPRRDVEEDVSLAKRPRRNRGDALLRLHRRAALSLLAAPPPERSRQVGKLLF